MVLSAFAQRSSVLCGARAACLRTCRHHATSVAEEYRKHIPSMHSSVLSPILPSQGVLGTSSHHVSHIFIISRQPFECPLRPLHQILGWSTASVIIRFTTKFSECRKLCAAAQIHSIRVREHFRGNERVTCTRRVHPRGVRTSVLSVLKRDCRGSDISNHLLPQGRESSLSRQGRVIPQLIDTTHPLFVRTSTFLSSASPDPSLKSRLIQDEEFKFLI